MTTKNISDFDILLNIQSVGYGYEYNQDNRLRELRLEVYGAGTNNTFTPNSFLHTLLQGYYKQIDKEKDVVVKLNIAIECKNILVHYIEEIKEWTSQKFDDNIPVKKYDFTSTIIKINSKCETLEKLCNNVKLRRDIYILKDARYWLGVLSGILIPMLGIFLKWFLNSD